MEVEVRIIFKNLTIIEYKLFAFISHLGSNTSCGHYIAHIKKEGRWVRFNDEKVETSDQPPINMGYIYFYVRENLAKNFEKKL